MGKFRIDSIAELARQMVFTPLETRPVQLEAAERLLREIEPVKAYPLDYIIFRITAYHPKLVETNLLTGIALQHDLGVLIEQVSETLHLRTAEAAEPVLMIEQVAQRFNVTSKTIQRWRRKGLAARRFTFADGKRRIGFFVSSVEKFLATHQDQVTRATNFSQVAEDEKDQIIRRARRLATACHCCAKEIARRIGRKLNRSPLTIAAIIREFDEQNPETAVFPRAAAPISDEDRGQIVKSFRRGIAVKSLAKRICRPRTAVYRVIIEDRLDRLNKKKIKFIDDPLYHGPSSAQAIEQMVAQEDIACEGPSEDSRLPRDLPPYLAAFCRTPLLTPAQERALFLKFNFHKYQFVTARRAIEPQDVRARDINLLESHRRKIVDTKNRIVRANLRLVISVARKHLRGGLQLAELLSEGNLTLMRAVDGFDVHKGNRFSTYATLALMKGFARSVPEMLSATSRNSGDLLDAVPDSRTMAFHDRMAQREEVHGLLARLDDRERDVLSAHYGLGDAYPFTHEELGRKLGLSRRRVREIEKTAMAKLRAAAVLQ